MGISQQSDAHAIIVSEETGGISVAYRGQFYLRLNAEELESLLTKENLFYCNHIPDKWSEDEHGKMPLIFRPLLFYLLFGAILLYFQPFLNDNYALLFR